MLFRSFSSLTSLSITDNPAQIIATSQSSACGVSSSFVTIHGIEPTWRDVTFRHRDAFHNRTFLRVHLSPATSRLRVGRLSDMCGRLSIPIRLSVDRRLFVSAPPKMGIHGASPWSRKSFSPLIRFSFFVRNLIVGDASDIESVTSLQCNHYILSNIQITRFTGK